MLWQQWRMLSGLGSPGTMMVADSTFRFRHLPFAKTGSFEWRGGEGSVTDRESGLVHMQARHYDPTLGRFLQADSLALASLTTQGTNRYLYTENDPVNGTDPSGHNPLLAVGLLILGVIGLLALAGVANGIVSWATGGTLSCRICGRDHHGCRRDDSRSNRWLGSYPSSYDWGRAWFIHNKFVERKLLAAHRYRHLHWVFFEFYRGRAWATWRSCVLGF